MPVLKEWILNTILSKRKALPEMLCLRYPIVARQFALFPGQERDLAFLC
jgi:hypothetical protein